MKDPETPLVLVRHGETSWNAAGRWQGHGDPPLSTRGRRQVLDLVERFRAEVGRDVARPWRRVMSSDLARARETAAAIAEALELELAIDRRLRELDIGAWTGLSREDIARQDPEGLGRFDSGDPHYRAGGGESRIDIRRRARDVVRDLVREQSGAGVVIVTHLGVIRALVPGAEPGNCERFTVDAREIAERPIRGAEEAESAGKSAPL